MNKALALTILMILLLGLAACGAEEPIIEHPEFFATSTPGAGESEPGEPGSLEWLATLPADTILLQQDYLPGFTRMELQYPFGRFAPFTLYADGRVIYTEEGMYFGRERVMQAILSPEDTLALYQQALDLGFTSLESHTDMCQGQPDGSQMCIADAGSTVLRMYLAGEGLREVIIYAGFANDPAAYEALMAMTTAYTYTAAQVYRPSGATLFLSRGGLPEGEHASPWPLDLALLEAVPGTEWEPTAFALAGESLVKMLNAAPRNNGEVFFEHDGAVFSGLLVPWLPGRDYSTEIEEAFPASLSAGGDATSEDAAAEGLCPAPSAASTGKLTLVYLMDNDVWAWTEGTEPISLGGGSAYSPLVTPDHTAVVFAHGEPPAQELWIAMLDGTTSPLRLAGQSELSGAITPFAFSSNGAWVAFTHALNPLQSELWAARTDGGGAKRLVSADDLMAIVQEPLANGAIPANLTWIPGTTRLTYDAQPTFAEGGIYIFVPNQVWTVDAATGEQTLLLAPGEGGMVSYSPDGRVMKLNSPDRLRFMDLASGKVTQANMEYAAMGVGEYYGYPDLAWTPDSTAILVAQPIPGSQEWDPNQEVDIYHVPIDGTQADKVFTANGQWFSFQLSPTQDQVVYWKPASEAANQLKLHIDALDGSADQVIATSPTVYFAGWSPNGKDYVFTTGQQPSQMYLGGSCGEPILISRRPSPSEAYMAPQSARWLAADRFLAEEYQDNSLLVYEGRLDGSLQLRLNLAMPAWYDAFITP